MAAYNIYVYGVQTLDEELTEKMKTVIAEDDPETARQWDNINQNMLNGSEDYASGYQMVNVCNTKEKVVVEVFDSINVCNDIKKEENTGKGNVFPKKVFDETKFKEIIQKLLEIIQKEIVITKEQKMINGNGMSVSGVSLLTDYEKPWQKENLRLDSEGNIIAIKNHDVGDGGITVGIGAFVSYGDKNQETMRILEKYGVDGTTLDEWVDIDTVKAILSEMLSNYTDPVDDLIDKSGNSFSQQQKDALYIMAYNRPRFFEEGHAGTQIINNPDLSQEEFIDIVMNEYKGLSKYEKYKDGWYNRTQDVAECYFMGDYERDH